MSATASTNLPSVDEWMTMRAKLVAVIGDSPATTLLSVLPQPVDGGFASNGRIDQFETRLRAEMHTEFADVRTEMRTGFADVRSEMRTAFADVRVEIADVRTEISKSAADTLKSMRAMFLQLIGVMCTLGAFAIAASKLL